MLDLSDSAFAVPSPLIAALLLAAVPHLAALGLPRPSAAEVLAATEVGRSRAFELRRDLLLLLPSLLRPVGRPPKVVPAADPSRVEALLRTVRDYLMDHGGAVTGSAARRRYSDGFRATILSLAAEHRDIGLPTFADAVGVPLPTLKDWLAGGSVALRPPDTLAAVPDRSPTEPQIETVLRLWSTWEGGFTPFVTDLNQNWRIPFRKTLVAGILEAHGVRFAKRRSGRSPDEDAIRGAFVTFFPNAQWVGDGAQIAVCVGAERFVFNLELVVDPVSGAFVGASIDPVEDGPALISAYQDAMATTGTKPHGLLVDNNPSNHTDEVRDAVAPAVIVPATPYRPQNKAHVEGAFGLFQQTIPDLVLVQGSPEDLARQLLLLVFVTFARVLNHRPRPDRKGLSRVALNQGHPPTPEEIAAAQAALQERLRRQALARQTLAARTDPLVRATLEAAFARLGFVDPTGALIIGIARYPVDAVVEGIAIVEGKRAAGTLPSGVDGRYLLGCVRNVAEEREGWEIALALWAERRRAGDRALDAAERTREQLDERFEQPEERVKVYVDQAMKTTRRLDRFFWLKAIVDVVHEGDPADERPILLLAARRISSTHAVPHQERQSAIRFLAAQLLPIG